MEMSRLTQDGTPEPVSRDQILKRERGQRNSHHFLCSADDEQNWQLYPVDPKSCYMCDHTTVETRSVITVINMKNLHTHTCSSNNMSSLPEWSIVGNLHTC